MLKTCEAIYGLQPRDKHVNIVVDSTRNTEVPASFKDIPNSDRASEESKLFPHLSIAF